jgi:tetratricopeptide (TPR) repeat protein
MKTRTDHPERFHDGGKVPWSRFYFLAQTLIKVGRLDEAEARIKQAMAVLKSDGIQFHPDMVNTMATLTAVYNLQGRKKEALAMWEEVRKLVPQVYPTDHPHYKNYMETM